MIAHLRANLLLIVLSLILCAVLYPLAVLGVGQGLFPNKASGSLVVGPDGKVVGSRLIAQEFKGDEWFQPRPSAASYKANASSGSNYGANNPKLRDRAARQLGPMVAYRPGSQPNSVQKDIETWFAAKADRLKEWTTKYPTSATSWMEDSDNAKAIESWQTANPGEGDLFTKFATKHPGMFPIVDKDMITPTATGPAIHATFFEMWLQANPEKAVDIQPVTADTVTASGSGLDPHITLRNAKSQLDRVAGAWATKTKTDAASVKPKIEKALSEASFDPLFGLAGGEALVNVLEVNLSLARQFSK